MRSAALALLGFAATPVACGLPTSGLEPEGPGAASTSEGAGGASTSATVAGATTTATGAGGGAGATPCEPGATDVCYEGPGGTEGVGPCAAGIATCAADGSSFGACAGQVLPAPESCGAPDADSDCDGATADCSEWARAFGSFGVDVAVGVAVDANGAAFTVGSFQQTASFGGASLVSQGGSDVFLVKTTIAGSHAWSKAFGGLAEQLPHAVASGASGDVVIAGELQGSADFGGGTLTSEGNGDVFVARLGGAGAHLWSQRFGGSFGLQTAHAVAIDPAADVVVTGQFFGSIGFGATTLTDAGAGDGFVAKLAGATGLPLWSKRFGGAGYDVGFGIAVDGAGDIAVVAPYQRAPDLGGGPLPNEPDVLDHNVLVAKLAPDGAHLWSRGFGVSGDQDPYAVAFDGDGNVVVVGDFSGQVTFGADSYTPLGFEDGFVVKLDPGGQVLWSKRLGGAGDEQPAAVAIDAAGRVFVSGFFSGTIDFGGGPLTSAGTEDAFVVALDPAGAHVYSARFGSAERQSGWAIAIDHLGSLRVAGEAAGSASFGATTLTSSGLADAFLARFFVP